MVFTKEELKKITDELTKNKQDELVLLVKLLMITGMRIEESLKLTWSDIGNEAILIHGKGGKERQFPRLLFPELEFILKNLKVKKRKDDRLFSWTSYAKLEKKIKDTCMQLGIYEKGKSFHSIRKYCENHLINNDDFNPYEVAEIMGHTIQIQEAHYKEILGTKRLTEKIFNRRQSKKTVRNLYGVEAKKHQKPSKN